MNTFFKQQEETINYRSPTFRDLVPASDMDLDIEVDDHAQELKIAALDFALYQLKEHIRSDKTTEMEMDLFEWQNKFNAWLELNPAERRRRMK